MSSALRTATKLIRPNSQTSRLRATVTRFPSCPTSLRHYSVASTDASSSTSEPSNTSSVNDVSPSDSLEAKLKAKEEELTDLTNRLKYAQADFINLQKISAREKEQTSLYAITNFARDLVRTVDVLSLALKSVPQTALESNGGAEATRHLKQLHEGVSMTQRELLSTLSKYGVTSFDPTGEPFDPNFHEALYEAPIPGKEPGVVIECSKLGYKIKDRTLRAAQTNAIQTLTNERKDELLELCNREDIWKKKNVMWWYRLYRTDGKSTRRLMDQRRQTRSMSRRLHPEFVNALQQGSLSLIEKYVNKSFGEGVQSGSETNQREARRAPAKLAESAKKHIVVIDLSADSDDEDATPVKQENASAEDPLSQILYRLQLHNYYAAFKNLGLGSAQSLRRLAEVHSEFKRMFIENVIQSTQNERGGPISWVQVTAFLTEIMKETL